jgi:hypothetical protein
MNTLLIQKGKDTIELFIKVDLLLLLDSILRYTGACSLLGIAKVTKDCSKRLLIPLRYTQEKGPDYCLAYGNGYC